MTFRHAQTGDSAQGQGCRRHRALRGLSLRLGGIVTHPRKGALRTQRALKRLSAIGAILTTRPTKMLCEHATTDTQNEVAPQRGNEVKP